jgi:hypothetical protein
LLTNAKLTVVHVTSLGMEETVFSPPGLGNNAVQTEQINIQNVKEIRLDLPASGALSFISFCQPANSGFSNYFTNDSNSSHSSAN